MSDQHIPFPFRPSASQLGQWISESLGIAALSDPSPRVAGGVGLRAITNDRPLRVDLFGWEAAADMVDAWNDLLGRALEDNVFLEPGFALTAAQHFAPGRRPSFLIVSDTSLLNNHRIIGICALEVANGFPTLTRSWLPKQAALGTPLLDRARGVEALDLILAWIEREHPKTVGLLWPALASNGPTADLIRARAKARGLDLRQFDKGERAILFGGVDVEVMLRKAMSAKHIKELRRQRRRLGEMGELTYVSSRRPDQIRFAVERFLTLEAGGWKGGRGTALLCDPAIAAFVRTMTRRLSSDGKCRVESLELNGAPIAMGIVLSTGKSAFLWKIAFAEEHAAYSPGVQFAIEFTRRQVLDGKTASTDSCAIPDHPMIDRLWPDKLPIADMAIATSRSRGKSFDAAIRRELMRRKLHDYAKRAFYAATGRRRN
jgi:hypothetical protein